VFFNLFHVAEPLKQYQAFCGTRNLDTQNSAKLSFLTEPCKKLVESLGSSEPRLKNPVLETPPPTVILGHTFLYHLHLTMDVIYGRPLTSWKNFFSLVISLCSNRHMDEMCELAFSSQLILNSKKPTESLRTSKRGYKSKTKCGRWEHIQLNIILWITAKHLVFITLVNGANLIKFL